MIGNALIIVGEIGGNDFNYGLLVGKSLDEIKPLVPLVISTVSSVITVNILSIIQFLDLHKNRAVRLRILKLSINKYTCLGVDQYGSKNDHGAWGLPNRMLDSVFDAVPDIKQRRVRSFNRMFEMA